MRFKPVYLIPLFIFSFSACSPDDKDSDDVVVVSGCKEIPALAVPPEKGDSLIADLQWLNEIHEYLEENTYTPLPEDTLKRLKSISTELELLSEDEDLRVHRARAKRMIAFDLQNNYELEASYKVLKKSLEELEATGINSPISQYERAYHYNLIAIYAELVNKTEISIANAKKSLQINAQQGFLTDMVKDYGTLAMVYSIIQRYDLEEQTLQQGDSIIAEYPDCFLTANDKSAIAAFSYIKARARLLEAQTSFYLGDTASTIKTLENVAQDIATTKRRLIEAGLENEPELNMRVKALEAVLGYEFNFIPTFADSTLNALRFLQGLAPSTHPQGMLFAMHELVWRSNYKQDCSGLQGVAYERAVSFIEELSINDMPQALKTTYLSVTRKLASYECTCGLLTGDQALLRAAKEKAQKGIVDFETFIGTADLQPNLESIGGNWRGYYSKAISVINRVDKELSSDGPSSPFSEPILSLSDRSKSIGLRLTFEKRKAFEAYGEEYKALYEEFSLLQKDLREAKSDGGDVIGKQDALMDFFQRLSSSPLPQKRQFYNDLRYFDQLSVPTIQKQLLTPQRAAIDIFYGLGEIVVSVITHNDRKQFVIPADQNLADALREIKNRTATGNKNAEYAYTIYRKILAPAIDWLSEKPDINQLIIIRDKVLADFAFGYLPIHEVTSSSWTSGKLLIDDYAISYAYSLSTLLAAREIQRARKPAEKVYGGFLATAGFSLENQTVPALPKFERTVTENTNQFFDPQELYSTSSKEVFLDNVSDYRYLAIAGHGYKDEYLDEQYFLQMHPSPENPSGRVTTSDLYTLNLSAELTLLLNCESARGTRYDFEGRKSLARSFIYAGSSAVIAGNDLLSEESYPEITDYFYEFWVVEKLPAQVALHEAKLKFRNENKGLAPYLWGNLIYYGVPDVYFFEDGVQ